MRISFGGFKYNAPLPENGRFTHGQLTEIQNDFSRELWKILSTDLSDHLDNISPGEMRKLKTMIEADANRMASKMITTALKVINFKKSKTTDHSTGNLKPHITGINSSMLMSILGGDFVSRVAGKGNYQIRNSSAAELRGMFHSEEVPWKAHSSRWAREKFQSQPQNAGKFFQHTGRLKSELTRYKTTIPQSLMGGVKVSLDRKYNRNKKRRLPKKLQNQNMQMILGGVEVKIFPKISPQFFPGLESRSWSTVDTNGRFEKRVLGTRRFAPKLIGTIPGKDYNNQRPLLQPIAQFFILYQIPQAVNKGLTRWLNSTQAIE